MMKKALIMFISLSILANVLLTLAFFNKSKWSTDPEVNLSVWINEATVNVYTFSYQNWANRQKNMAQYFLPEAWTAYLNAINQSNILKQMQDKHMVVTAVATLPPTITQINPKLFKAKITLLVQYKGDTESQIQHLNIELEIVKTDTNGFRGFAINQFIANIDNAPCICQTALNPKITIV